MGRYIFIRIVSEDIRRNCLPKEMFGMSVTVNSTLNQREHTREPARPSFRTASPEKRAGWDSRFHLGRMPGASNNLNRPNVFIKSLMEILPRADVSF